MGGEGSMAAANLSLKSNRSLLSKRKKKAGLSGSYSNIKLKEFPKATPQELKRIREKLKREHKEIRIKQFIVFGVVIIILVSIFLI